MNIPILQRMVCRSCLVIILVLFEKQVSAAIHIPDYVKKDTSTHTREVVRLLYAYDSIRLDNWDSGIVILKQALQCIFCFCRTLLL